MILANLDAIYIIFSSIINVLTNYLLALVYDLISQRNYPRPRDYRSLVGSFEGLLLLVDLLDIFVNFSLRYQVDVYLKFNVLDA